MSDVQVGEEAAFGSNNIVTSRQLHTASVGVEFIVKDIEQRVLREMVREAARFGIDEADVLALTEITWRCEARARLVVKELPEKIQLPPVPEVCICGNRYDGDNLCMISACEQEV